MAWIALNFTYLPLELLACVKAPLKLTLPGSVAWMLGVVIPALLIWQVPVTMADS